MHSEGGQLNEAIPPIVKNYMVVNLNSKKLYLSA